MDGPEIAIRPRRPPEISPSMDGTGNFWVRNAGKITIKIIKVSFKSSNKFLESKDLKMRKDCWVSILLHSVIYVISCLTEWRSFVRPGSSPNREALTWRSLRHLCHFLDTFRRGSFCEDLWQYKMDEKLLVDLLTYIPVEWILVWEPKMMIIENWSESNRTRRGTERRLGFLFGGSGYHLKMVLFDTESNGLRVPHFWNPRWLIVIELHRME